MIDFDLKAWERGWEAGFSAGRKVIVHVAPRRVETPRNAFEAVRRALVRNGLLK